MPDRNGQPPQQPTPRTCGSCGGTGGFPDTTPTPFGHATVFRTCGSCGGTGTQGGGI